MLRFFSIALTCLSLTLPALSQKNDELEIIVIVGSPGSSKYESIFSESAKKWRQAASRGRARISVIGLDGEADASPSDSDRFQQAIESSNASELWLVLIGHGTFDTRTVKFNARGPDFTDSEFAAWVLNFEGDLAVINTASSSGSFIPRLSGPDRTIITATKSESEMSFTRFGGFFADAIGGNPDADLDNDDQVSLLESFLYASDLVAKYYEGEGRLATEHSLLDDNGDGKGSRAEWFEGTTPTQVVEEGAEPDGERASQKVLVKNDFERRLTVQQRQRRDTLEREVKQLRRNRDGMEEEPYYQRLEELLLKLAKIYEAVGDS